MTRNYFAPPEGVQTVKHWHQSISVRVCASVCMFVRMRVATIERWERTPISGLDYFETELPT